MGKSIELYKTKKFFLTSGRVFILALYFIFVAAPIYWMIVTAFKTDTEIVNVNNVSYFPLKFTFNNFISLFSQLKFGNFLKNSLILSLCSAVIVVIYSILGGYALARYKFKGKNPIIIFFLLSQMIPGVLVTIPIYLIYAKLHLINTLFGLLVIYVITNTPFCRRCFLSFERYAGISCLLICSIT